MRSAVVASYSISMNDGAVWLAAVVVISGVSSTLVTVICDGPTSDAALAVIRLHFDQIHVVGAEGVLEVGPHVEAQDTGRAADIEVRRVCL